MGKNLQGLSVIPQTVESEWLSKITNIPSTIVSIGFNPVDNAELINSISRSVVQQRGLRRRRKIHFPAKERKKLRKTGETVITDRPGR